MAAVPRGWSCWESGSLRGGEERPCSPNSAIRGSVCSRRVSQGPNPASFRMSPPLGCFSKRKNLERCKTTVYALPNTSDLQPSAPSKAELPYLSFEIQTKVFREAIRQVFSVVGRGNLSNPVLSHLLFQIDEGDSFLTIVASDGILSIKSIVQISVLQSPGRTTAPAKRIFDLLKGMPDGNLVVVGHDEGFGLTMFNGKSRFRLHGVSAIEFPGLPVMSSASTIVFPCEDLLSCLLNTKFASAKDDNSMQNLNGVNMKTGNGEGIMWMASDTRLFACNVCQPIQVNSDSNLDVVFPIKAVDEVCRILNEYIKLNSKKSKVKSKSKSTTKSRSKGARSIENNDDNDNVDEDSMESAKMNVTLNVSKERMELVLNNGTILTSQCMNFDYPNLIPFLLQKPQVSFCVDRIEFMNSIKQMSLFCSKSNSDSNLNPLHLSLSKDSLSLSAGSHGLGSAMIKLDIEYDDVQFEIGFNPWLLLEIMSHLSRKIVVVGLSSNGGGCAIIHDEDQIDDVHHSRKDSTFLLSAMLGSSPHDFGNDVIPF